MLDWVFDHILEITALTMAVAGQLVSYAYLVGRMSSRFEAIEKDVAGLALSMRTHTAEDKREMGEIKVVMEKIRGFDEDVKAQGQEAKDARKEVLDAVGSLRAAIDLRFSNFELRFAAIETVMMRGPGQPPPMPFR